MNEVLAASVGGLLALALWGVSDWLAGKSSKKFGNQEVNLAVQGIGIVIVLPIFLLSGHGLPSASHILILLVAELFITVAYICFIKALAVGQAGIVVPLSNVYPLFTLAAAFLFLTAKFSVFQVAAMIMIIGGAVLLGTEKLKRGKRRENVSQEVVYSLLAALLWGIGIFILDIVVDKLPWESILAVVGVGACAYTLLFFAIKNKKGTLRTLKRLPENKTGIISGLTLTLGSIAFFVAGEIAGSILIIAVIASASPLVISLLAAVYEKERIIFSKRIGAVLVVAGVILLNLP